MEWIDAHVHIGHDRKFLSSSYDEVRTFLDEGILDRAVVFSMNEVDGIPKGNERIRDVVDRDDRLAGLFRIDPAVHEPRDLLDTDGYAGFKIHPSSQKFTLEEFRDYLDAIEETGKPVLSHTGEWGEEPHPESLLETALDYPGIDIVFAHGLYGYVFHAGQPFLESMRRHDNVYVDLSIHHTAPGLAYMARHIGADKLLFASDYPYGMPQTAQTLVTIADITEEEKEMVAGGNARKLFF